MALARLTVHDIDLMQEIINTKAFDDCEVYETKLTQLETGGFKSNYVGTCSRAASLFREAASQTGRECEIEGDRPVLIASRQRYETRFRVSGNSMPSRTGYYLVGPATKLLRCRGITANPDDLIEVPPGSEMDFVAEGASLSTFILNNDVRDAIYRTASHASALRVLPLKPASANSLRWAIAGFLRYHRSNGNRGDDGGMLARAFANCISDINAEAGANEDTSSLHRAVLRAEAYLHEHLEQVVPTYALAAWARVSLRSLQMGFMQQFGLTPYAYHTRLRLQAARRYLLRQEPEATSVTSTALAFGFTHFGRFAANYKSLFGETPRQTLHCRRVFWAVEGQSSVTETDR